MLTPSFSPSTRASLAPSRCPRAPRCVRRRSERRSEDALSADALWPSPRQASGPALTGRFERVNRNGFTGIARTVSAHIQTSSGTEHRSPSPHAKQSTRRVPSPRPASARSSPATRLSDAQLVGIGTAQPAEVSEGPLRAPPSPLVASECAINESEKAVPLQPGYN